MVATVFHVAIEPLKCGQFKVKHANRVKFTLDLDDLV